MSEGRWAVRYGTQRPLEVTKDDLDRMTRDFHDERRDRAVRAAKLKIGETFAYYDTSVERTVTVTRIE